MVSAGDFKNGLTVEIEGVVYQILEFQHVKPGKGAAFVRTKLKNIINGGVVEKTFRPTEKFENAHIERSDGIVVALAEKFVREVRTKLEERFEAKNLLFPRL